MNYIRHSIALTPQEEEEFKEVKQRTGFGVTAIFKAMVKALKQPVAIQEEE